uniref:Uncharacterized protein LOC111102017 n=1 Tax=Crassostrea virginica TaxID=6565 RepID=A0A8B8AK28_CRAVI|nr:uncharacterized protein LOC111102017 [Crassostrea virginica]
MTIGHYKSFDEVYDVNSLWFVVSSSEIYVSELYFWHGRIVSRNVLCLPVYVQGNIEGVVTDTPGILRLEHAKDACQGTTVQTAPSCVLILPMVTDVKDTVTVTRTAVMCLQDVGLRPQLFRMTYLHSRQ